MSVRIITGDCRKRLSEMEPGSVHCCVTSPPYFGLRDYGVSDQIGLEDTPEAYVNQLVDVFRDVRRVLRDDGTLWLNLGDSYAGSRAGDQGAFGQMANRSVAAARGRVRGENQKNGVAKPKDLIGIPWMVAFALRADGWYLRQEIIWHKPNPMPESVTDRCTKAHEQIFLLSKSPRYYYDADAIAEPAIYGPDCGWADVDQGGFGGKGVEPTQGQSAFRAIKETRNKRSVWTVPSQPYSEAHFATFPPSLIEPCILAGCPVGGTVLDPFGGAGTTGLVADRLGRNAVLIELNPEYARLAENRIHADAGMFASVAAS